MNMKIIQLAFLEHICLCLSVCHLQIVTAYLTLIHREVTVFGSLGIPLAGPIRPQGGLPVQPASAVSSDEPLMTGEAEPFELGAISQITVIKLLCLRVTLEQRHVHIHVSPSISAPVLSFPS